jgi:hypothetical protein
LEDFFWNEKLKERKRERGGRIAFEDEIEMRKERKEK